jgi:hypothetical protein
MVELILEAENAAVAASAISASRIGRSWVVESAAISIVHRRSSLMATRQQHLFG